MTDTTDRPGVLVVTGTRHEIPHEELILGFDAGVAFLEAQGVTRIQVFHGNYAGVDTQAKNEALRRGWKQVPFKANWRRFGAAAGPMRNGAMLKKATTWGCPLVVVAFPRGKSSGTKDCIAQARALGLEPLIFPAPEPELED